MTNYATAEFKDGHVIYREVIGPFAWLHVKLIDLRSNWRRYRWSKIK